MYEPVMKLDLVGSFQKKQWYYFYRSSLRHSPWLYILVEMRHSPWLYIRVEMVSKGVITAVTATPLSSADTSVLLYDVLESNCGTSEPQFYSSAASMAFGKRKKKKYMKNDLFNVWFLWNFRHNIIKFNILIKYIQSSSWRKCVVVDWFGTNNHLHIYFQQHTIRMHSTK